MKNNLQKSIFKNILITLMVLCFSVLATTGIIKFRNLLKFFNISNKAFQIKNISVVHDWAGITLVVLITFHLFLQRSWFGRIYKKISNYKKIIFIVIGGILLFIAYFAFQSGFMKSESKRLSDVEVKEYQGENLSSITDFRENSIKGPQYIDKDEYRLEIDGLVKNKMSLTYNEVTNHDKYSKVVTLYCVEGWSAKILWEGVLLSDLLKSAEIEKRANTVIFHAYDGYSSSLPLDYLLENNILLAYKMNDVVLPPERGFPFQVVAENKWGYKWVRWVTKIELSDDESYRGYWESAGYNQEGDLSGSKFE